MNNAIPELLKRKTQQEQMDEMTSGPRFGQLREKMGMPSQSMGVLQSDQNPLGGAEGQSKGLMEALQKGEQDLGIPAARNDMMFSQESPEDIKAFSDNAAMPEKEKQAAPKKEEDKFDYEGMGDALSKVAGSGAEQGVAKMSDINIGQSSDNMAGIRAKILEGLMGRG